MRKIFMSLLTVVVLSCICLAPVYANDMVYRYTPLANGIDPRMSYISGLTVTLTPSGRIRLAVNTNNCDFYAVLDLQEYVDGRWQNVDGYEWTLYGNTSDSVSDTCSLESGVRYRAYAYVAALDDSGNVIEQAYGDTVPFVAP